MPGTSTADAVAIEMNDSLSLSGANLAAVVRTMASAPVATPNQVNRDDTLCSIRFTSACTFAIVVSVLALLMAVWFVATMFARAPIGGQAA